MGKRGVSGVVAAVLLIMIVVVFVSVLWASIIPRVNSNLNSVNRNIDLEIITDTGYTFYDWEKDYAFVKVFRGNDKLELDSVQILLDFEGKTYKVILDGPMPNEAKRYIFDLERMGWKEPGEVAVAPIFLRGGVTILGDISSKIMIPFAKLNRNVEELVEEVENDPKDFIIGLEEGIFVYDFVNCDSGLDDYGRYVICTCKELEDISNIGLDMNYTLGQDIDCSDSVNWDGGEGFEPIGGNSNLFEGTFDGRRFEISDVVINRPQGSWVGLFAGSKGSLINIKLKDVNIVGFSQVASLLGVNSGEGSIENCHSSGIVSGNLDDGLSIGGLVGHNNGGNINASSFGGSVKGANGVGGLVGNNGGDVGNSYTSGNVTGETNQIGGLVGVSGGDVSNSYTVMDVDGGTGATRLGGLVGSLGGNLENSYAVGNVSGKSEIGGLVGNEITWDNINNSYWYNRSQGLDCYNNGNENCVAISEIEYFYSKTNPPMNGVWDFENIWKETSTFPELR